MAESARYICVGAVAGAFGVRGELRIKSFTAEPADIFDYAPFVDEAGAAILTIASWRAIKDGFIAIAEEVASREDAIALKSTRLFVARDRLPEPPEEEYYHADLVGMAVKDLEGRDMGRVRAVQNYGAGDLLEIFRTPGVTGSWFLPFTLEAAPHIDLEAGEVIVDPPPGAAPERPEEA